MKHKPASLIAISNSKSTGQVFVYNLFWELLLIVSSTGMLAAQIESNFYTIKSSVRSGTLFRGNWYFTNSLVGESVVPKYNQDSEEAQALYSTIKRSKHIRKAVFVFNADTFEYISTYNGVIECAKDLKISHNTIKKAMASGSSIQTNTRVRSYIFSAHRINKPT